MSAPPAQGAAFTKEDVLARAAVVRARAQAAPDLETLRREVAACTACGLCADRTQTVFADGDGSARVLFVGAAPGANEDEQGIPFVGRAGSLLTDIIEKGMGLPRKQVMITNVLKCRPPENRDPSPAEKHICTSWLERQVQLSGARVVIPLGNHAAGQLLQQPGALLGQLRGQAHERDGHQVIPTFDPGDLLRSPDMKKECWKDIQRAMTELGLKPPA